MEPDIPLSVEGIIAQLGHREQSLSNADLAYLSDLNTAELGLFERAWPRIGAERRRHILQRLVELAEDNATLDFGHLFRSCLKDEDAEVRSLAIEGLWENEDASLINPLILLMEQDSSEAVQLAAVTTLGKFAMLAELEKIRPQYRDRIGQSLLMVVNDLSRPVAVRRRALEAVAPLSLPAVKQAITDTYRGGHPQFNASALYAMGKNCDPDWLPILISEMDNPRPEIRYEAAVACGELAEEAAVDHLVRLTGDPDIEVQLAALQALAKVGGMAAKEGLQDCLSDPREVVREAAAQAIKQLEIEEDPLSLGLNEY